MDVNSGHCIEDDYGTLQVVYDVKCRHDTRYTNDHSSFNERPRK